MPRRNLYHSFPTLMYYYLLCMVLSTHIYVRLSGEFMNSSLVCACTNTCPFNCPLHFTHTVCSYCRRLCVPHRFPKVRYTLATSVSLTCQCINVSLLWYYARREIPLPSSSTRLMSRPPAALTYPISNLYYHEGGICTL